MAPKFQTQFNHGKLPAFKCETPSMTEQQFEFETNINNIVSQQVNSSLPAQTSQALYGLTITGDEYEKQLNAVAEVQNYFEELPVKAKEYFDYKPQNMIDFFKNDDNYEKAHELGLIDSKAYNARKEQLAKATEEFRPAPIQPASTVTPATGDTSNSMA